jgi:hypothetical protein
VRPPAGPQAEGRGAGRFVAGAALLAMVALVIVTVARRPAPGAGPAPMAAPAPAPAPAPDAAASTDAAELDAAPTTAAPAPKPAGGEDAETGTVVFPPRATGHRIFVDGRRARTEETDEGIAPLRLRCGPHEIQIGSGGTPETIEIPCGGRVQIQ